VFFISSSNSGKSISLNVISFGPFLRSLPYVPLRTASVLGKWQT
jgi:hypothetical protein